MNNGRMRDAVVPTDHPRTCNLQIIPGEAKGPQPLKVKCSLTLQQYKILALYMTFSSSPLYASVSFILSFCLSLSLILL